MFYPEVLSAIFIFCIALRRLNREMKRAGPEGPAPLALATDCLVAIA
jgi:hypothetical protein